MSSSAPRVMIVEDDRETLERFARAILSDPRMNLGESTGLGRTAIARLPVVRPDVLLVDLGLPDISGIDVIRYAACALEQCDIMVITVFGDEVNVMASIEAGATGYVLKDCDDQELVAHILDLRAGGSPISPGVARLVLKRMRARGDERRASGVLPVKRQSEDQEISLTPREVDVLRLMSRGYTYAEIGEQLGVSVHTVTSHIKNSYRKLAVRSAAAAVTRAAQLRLLGDG